ncbi:MAG: ABC transporter permease [Pyrinomonadaceae bacterium]
MAWWKLFLDRMRALRDSESVHREIDEELRFHLDMRAEENVRRGMPPEEARREAERRFGRLTRIKEMGYEVRGGGMLETLRQDLRYGARMLRKNPGFTLVTVLTLALGIGANTALFSVVDALLFKSLPVKEPGRLVLFRCVASPTFSPGPYAGYDGTDAAGRRVMTSFAYQTFRRIRQQQSVLSDVFAYGDLVLNVNADGQADIANGQAVSGNYYAGLGVGAIVGRTITNEDDQGGARPVAVLSHRYWQRRFGGDPSVVGKQINLNDTAFTVVGVTPPGFEGTMQVGSTQDVTIPLAWEPRMYTDPKNSRMYGAGQWWLRVMGRLQPGATAEQARAQVETAFHQSVAEHHDELQTSAQTAGDKPISEVSPQQYPRLFLDPGGQGEMNERERYASSFYLLLGVVALVLLVACANVANLFLARVTSRQKEIGLRLALGASRFRLVRQLLTESLLLAGLGGTAGLLVAFWIKEGLLSVTDWGGRGMLALQPRLDLRVLVFTLALSLLTGIVFGLAPAWRATKVNLAPMLNGGGRGSSAATRSPLNRGLIISQVALSLLLLVGAGLFVRTLGKLRSVESGFDGRNLLLFNVQPDLVGYKGERMARLYEALAERIEGVPGVRQVTFSRVPLLARVRSTRSVYLRDSLAIGADATNRVAANGQCNVNLVRENFLEVMGIPLLTGRPFDMHDGARAPKVVVVNQTFVRKYFPGENPVGKSFTFDVRKPDELEIIGIVRDAKYASQREEIPPTVYVSWRQGFGDMNRATFEVRTTGEPNLVIADLRRAAREVDANLPLNDVRTQSEQADQTLTMERLLTKLLTLFGLLAQSLAAVGLYGVLSYGVAQRTREIGIRMALGASRSAVVKMVMRYGLTLTCFGVAAGVLTTYAVTRYLESRINLSSMLYGVTLSDPATYAVIASLLMLTALAACYFPARRATKVDPLTALRND